MLAILLGVYWNRHISTSTPKRIAANPLKLQVLFNVLIVHTETALKYGGGKSAQKGLMRLGELFL